MLQKRTNKYYFSTEGETEKWYLEYLQNLINNSDEATCKVSFRIKVTNPLSFIKQQTLLKRTNVYHLFDYESDSKEHKNKFIKTLSEMKKAEKFGKDINYLSGYTNLTFELWIILHKMDCYSSFTNRKNYLQNINKIFSMKLENLKEYKVEKTFKNCLNTLTLQDVKTAIKRVKTIMKNNEYNEYKLEKYQNFTWYNENPATKVGSIIEKILLECGIK